MPRKQEWKYIEGSKDCYISNLGNVRRKTDNSYKMINPKISNGYYRVTIPGLKERMWVHRLVATYFCDNKTEQRNIVNHIDGNKTNNYAENLEWVTSYENSKKASESGLFKGKNINSYRGKIMALKVTDNNEIDELLILPNANSFVNYSGIDSSQVSRALSNNESSRKTTNGWRLYRLEKGEEINERKDNYEEIGI